MKTGAGLPASAPEPVKPFWRRFFGMPQTRPGRWSLWCGLGFILAFALMQVLVAAGQAGGDKFFDNPALSLTGLAGLGFILAAAILAAVAIFRLGERSLFSILALLFGLLISTFLVFEFTVPH